MERTIPTKEQVLEAAKKCPQTKEALAILFPEDFENENEIVLIILNASKRKGDTQPHLLLTNNKAKGANPLNSDSCGARRIAEKIGITDTANWWTSWKYAYEIKVDF